MTEENKEISTADISPEKPTENLSDSQIRNVLSPGAILRARRESTGAELDLIARELNLDPWMLKALEEDDFSKFGAQVFAKGHLKHYAEHLGLNPDDVLFAYYQVAERKETTPVIKRHISSATQKKSYASLLKWFTRLLGLLALLALVYAAYIFSQSWLKGAKESSSATTEISLSPNSDSVGAIAPPINSIEYADAASNQSEIEQLEKQNSEPAENDVGLVSEDSSSPETTDTDIADSVVSSNLNVNTQQGLLRMVFNEETWVEVFTDENESLIYDIQQPGTVQELNLAGPTSIFLGNYPGVELSYNGEAYVVPRSARAGKTARFVIEPK